MFKYCKTGDCLGKAKAVRRAHVLENPAKDDGHDWLVAAAVILRKRTKTGAGCHIYFLARDNAAAADAMTPLPSYTLAALALTDVKRSTQDTKMRR
jgi:hypothetical protein